MFVGGVTWWVRFGFRWLVAVAWSMGVEVGFGFWFGEMERGVRYGCLCLDGELGGYVQLSSETGHGLLLERLFSLMFSLGGVWGVWA